MNPDDQPGSWWWLSSNRLTVAVRVIDGRVVQGPPVVERFRGQDFSRLMKWFRKQDGFRYGQLS